MAGEIAKNCKSNELARGSTLIPLTSKWEQAGYILGALNGHCPMSKLYEGR